MLTARKLVQSKLRDIENSLRGILRGFGLKVGKTTERRFAGRIQELVAGHPNLETIAQALLAVHAVLVREFNAFEKRVRSMAKADAKAMLLMSTPSVGPIVALTYASAVDDPGRFKSSKQAARMKRQRNAGAVFPDYHPGYRKHRKTTGPSMQASKLIPWSAGALAVLLGASPARAQAPAEFYKGKTIELDIGLSVGGGYDASPWSAYTWPGSRPTADAPPNVYVRPS